MRKQAGYAIEAQNIHGAIALGLQGHRFLTMKDALNLFDSIYSRKGWKIKILKENPDICYELELARIVKSTYR